MRSHFVETLNLNPLRPWKFPTRAAQLTPSLTLSIDSKAKAMKAEGIDVCGFGAGEPDFDTPEHIKAAAIAALEAGFTKYTPSAGLPELRQAIADKFAGRQRPRTTSRARSSSATARSIPATTPSSRPARTGDEVLIPSPYWVSYPDMVRLAGAEPVIVQTNGAQRLEDDAPKISRTR